MKKILPTILAAVLAAGALATTAHATSKPQPPIPADLQVEAGNNLVLVGHALGVQIYQCNGAGAWTFVAPEALLVDDRGRLIIHHFGGPTWQHRDGSKVVGALAKPGVTVDPKSIPWLLLRGASSEAGPFGGSTLQNVTFIQRINTRGGLAPAANTCTTRNSGEKRAIPYSADYNFYKAAKAA
jgi:hypothetical protein